MQYITKNKFKVLLIVVFTIFLIRTDLTQASVVYSQPYIGNPIDIGKSNPIESRFYLYFFGGGNLNNPPTDLGYWTATSEVSKIRVKKISGSCSDIANSGNIFDSNLNLIGGWLYLSESSFGDYCEMNIRYPIAVGTEIAMVAFVAGNVQAVDMILDGSEVNSGISTNGIYSKEINGGFAFQFCDTDGCGNEDFQTPEVACVVDCFSNILFLPGFEGSNLYEDTAPTTGCQDPSGLCEKKRWLPEPFLDSDIRKLYLDDNSTSLNEIYTKDILGQVFGISNIYKTFLDNLSSWKYTEQLINDYAAIPYDWRFSPPEIIAKGKKDSLGRISYTKQTQQNETSYIVSEILRLSESSKTKKVTIIAHSYGGLITKELMLKLREIGKEDLVDKIILVAVPEVGTPYGLKALLHGASIGPLGFISDAKLTREFGRNLPGVYSLLPSSNYYTTEAGNTPVVSFDDSEYFDNTRAKYGFGISNFTELENYLKNLEGRILPTYTDLNHANILNNNLVDEANILHNRLDLWTPGPNTKVIEVAGWGEYTLGGIRHKTEKECINRGVTLQGIKLIYTCLEYGNKQVLDTVDTLEGDGTVVSPSAHYLSDKNTPNTERWWVDLEGYNRLFVSGSILNITHKDILEIPDLVSFIKNKINNSQTNFLYLSQVKPTSDKTITRIKLNSPLSLDLYDSLGNHTGLTSNGEIEENIPGSRYRTIGESKYIIVPRDVATSIKLKGYQEGSFSLNIDTLEGDIVTSSTTFSAIPSSISTVATLDLPANTNISSSTPLKIDFNGDGIVDIQIIPKFNEGVVYDTLPPELNVVFDTNTKDIVFSAIDNIDPNPEIFISNNTVTLTDFNGNITIVPFTKYKEAATRLNFSYNKIIKNGATTMIPNTNVSYSWQEKKGTLTDLDTRVTIKGEESHVFNYKKSNNTTVIKEKKGKNLITTTMLGFVAVTITTNNNDLNIKFYAINKN